jgi:hypothetical protein
MWKSLFLIVSVALTAPMMALAQSERSGRYEVEAGILSTRNMEIHGYEQGNATSDWKSTEPTARFEYWSVRKNH